MHQIKEPIIPVRCVTPIYHKRNMHRTIFDSRFLSVLLRLFSKLILKLIGWRAEGVLCKHHRFVMIAAPHTSNWDLVIMLMIGFVLRVKVFWLGKKSIFKKPFKHTMQWLGGISVDRSKGNNTVAQAVQAFNKYDELIIIIPPEGTRKKVKSWKTGFYYVALGAQVPIVLGYLDYARKVGGIGPTLIPTGDIDADMKRIKSFYANVKGKYASNWDNQHISVKHKQDP